jgi:hypothetical protein
MATTHASPRGRLRLLPPGWEVFVARSGRRSSISADGSGTWHLDHRRRHLRCGIWRTCLQPTFDYVPASRERKTQVRQRSVCRRHGVDVKATAIQFRSAPAVTSVVGAASVAEVEEDGACQAPVPTALWEVAPLAPEPRRPGTSDGCGNGPASLRMGARSGSERLGRKCRGCDSPGTATSGGRHRDLKWQTQGGGSTTQRHERKPCPVHSGTFSCRQPPGSTGRGMNSAATDRARALIWAHIDHSPAPGLGPSSASTGVLTNRLNSAPGRGLRDRMVGEYGQRG